MKYFFAFVQWSTLVAIVLIFLVLPDFASPEMARPGFFPRAFFTFFLCNAFFGLMKIFNNPLAIEEDIQNHQTVDKETLIISNILGHLFYVVSTISLCVYGLYSFYPMVGSWKYSFGVFYGILISMMHYKVNKLQLRKLNKNKKE